MELIVASVGGFFTALLWQFFGELFRRETREERQLSKAAARRARRHQSEATCFGGF